MKDAIGYALLTIILIPSALVCLELFWFAGRCTKGGHCDFQPHERGAGWVYCTKCAMEDF